MRRWALVLGCALSLLGCSGDDGGGSDGGGGFLSSGSGGTAGSGGSGGTSGSGGNAGTGGQAGTTSSGGAGGVVGGAGGGGGGNGGAGGTGGASGQGSSGAGGGSSGDVCGGRGNPECPAGSYCNYPPEADCGRFDAPGACTVLTDVACGEIYQPVCGCDGQTYGNPCSAAQAGMSVDHEGECEGAEGGYDCNLDGVACFIAVPQCEEGQVPSVDGSCFGPCVPIEQCACNGPEDCPNEEQYTCWLSAGHCGPYTQ